MEIARSLVARDVVQVADGDLEEVSVALKRTCSRISENICDSMGEAGWAALLARALARTASVHPVLGDIRRPAEGALDLCRVVAGVEVHGVAAVTAAIEAVLAALIEILGRLIGEDMAVRLIDQDSPRSAPDGGGQAT